MVFNLSISEKYEDFFNRIVAIAEITNVSTSSLIMKSVKMYIDKIDNIPSLMSDPTLWDKTISKMSKKQLEETNTLLFRLNKKIMESYASTT